MLQDKIFKLKGKVMHYAWGGYDFIPNWLNIENTGHIPYAEYWMGSHSSSSSDVVTPDGNLSLASLIKNDPGYFLGEKVQNQFKELPYLFKILDVREMLSIQVHPSKVEAERGFEAEERAGIPINSPVRNYKDKNHKPEVMVALSEFWLLHGFLEKDALWKTLDAVPEFRNFIKLFDSKGYEGLYQHVMEMPQEQVNELLRPLVLKEQEHRKNNELSREQPGWWVTKLYEQEAGIDDIDRGIFSIYFFNIVKVNPGEAVFQGAGIPHAYLEGQNVELMANSDNVLRGGLTPKHIDIPELMKHTVFEAVVPNVMKGIEDYPGLKNFFCPVPDFSICKIESGEINSYITTATSLEIITVIKGVLQIEGSNSLTLHKGETAAILSGETYTVTVIQPALAYKAFVP